MLNGMNPLAWRTVTVGCTSDVSESSATTADSEWNAHETPALATPFHAFV